MAHATLSPSSADRWMTCPGSVALSAGLPDEGSGYAAEGTAAHYFAEQILIDATNTDLVGTTAPNGVLLTPEMLAEVSKYTDMVNEIKESTGGTLFIEQKLPIEHVTGELGATGTADVVIVAGREIIVIDLKYGMGVPVYAEKNRQGMTYALGAVEHFSVLAEFDQARIVICQPRLNNISEWVVSVDDLNAFAKEVGVAALACSQPDAPLVPSEKACRFCRAKANCPALAAEVYALLDSVDPKGETGTPLGDAMAKVDLVEGWCKAIRAKCESELLAGRPVPGWKLVQGRQGNRKWTNEAEVEALLKSKRLKMGEMYDFSLVSPTTLTKRYEPWVDSDGNKREPVLGPRQRKEVNTHITRSEGKPSVAPESDKRPALAIGTDDFDSLV